MSSGLHSGVSGLALGTGLYRNTSGLWGNASGLINGFDGNNPYAGASLYLNFLTGQLDSRITFSRGTNATLIDSTGRLTYAPANLLQRSQEITVSPWAGDTSGGTVPTATANAGIAPDGTNTATRLQINRGAGAYSRWQQIGISGPSNLYIASIWMRTTSGTGTANVGLRNDVDGVNCVVTGTWQRFWMRNLTPTVTPNIQILSWTSIPGTDVSADILVWGGQLEPVTYQTTPSTYVATTSAAYYGPRFDYDPVTLAPRGLLIEEARTNTALHSADITNAVYIFSASSATANVTTAPDGTQTADKAVEDNTNATHRFYQPSIVTTTSAFSVSVYLKAAERTFAYFGVGNGQYTRASINLTTGATGALTGPQAANLTIRTIASGNGWWRVIISGTFSTADLGHVWVTISDNGAESYLGNGTSGIYVWGYQGEAGSFATSYIPTVASTVTRNADVATMTGTNFSSWYNSVAGSFVTAFDTVNAAGVGYIYSANAAGSINNSIYQTAYLNSTDNYVFSGGAQQARLQSGVIASNVPASTSLAYALDSFASSTNGSAVATDASGLLPVGIDRINIGYSAGGASFLNGHIRTIAYFNTRLPNAQLQTLTAPSLATTLSLDFTTGSYNVGF